MNGQDIFISDNTPKGREAGAPHLLYVSSWNQDTKALPRSLHSHQDFAELTFILAGQGICEVDGQFYPTAKGDVIIFNRGILHDEFADSHPIALVSIAADGIQLPDLPENCILPPDMPPIFSLEGRMPVFHQLVSILAEEAKSNDVRRGLISQSIFLALFYMTLDAIDLHYRKSGKLDSAAADSGHQIRAYVDAHITEELSVQAVAHDFDISPSYLARIFKRATGYPLSKYIIRRRLGEAQTLLLNSSLPISEIAARVGYPNQSYFTKLFTQAFHVSPLQYRKISRERLINLSASVAKR